MTDTIDPDAQPGEVDHVLKRLFPSLYPDIEPDAPWSKPCVRGPCPGGCIDHDHSRKRELEAGS